MFSGIVPVVVMAVAAFGYPRLRAGARAALAISFGGIALGSGIAVPVRHAIIDRPSGDDYTGFLATLAGLVLFLIFATHGQGGEELQPKYYESAGEPKTLWEIEDAKHTGGLDAHPAEYERRVMAFFDRALLKST